MNGYKCRIKLKSSIETPLEADIIWGSIIWSLKYFYGKEEVEKTIKEYAVEAPLIISDGFPAGYLPGPLNNIAIEKIENIIVSYENNNLNRIIKTVKNLLHRDLLPDHIFRNIIMEPDKLIDIIKDCLECEICPKSLEYVKTSEEKFPNDICNKNSCFYLTGQNYSKCNKITEKNSHDYSMKKGELWDIYIVSKWSKDKLLELLTFMGMNGYGRGASRGKGYFVIENFIELSLEERLDTYRGKENGFMTLSSSYIPLAGEIEDIETSRYKLLIKVGKLGGHWASMENFFKYPMVMCKRGSVFPASPETKKYWGGLVKGVHQEIEEVVQYGLAFPVWGSFFEKR